MKKWYRDRYLWLSALAGLLMSLAAMLVFVISDGGFMALRDDFDYQQIYFNYLSGEAIKSGSLGWSWSIDLGSDVITSMSFYTLGSPFFWLLMLFPAKAVPYIMCPLLALKYAVASAGSYLYIKRFTKKETSALIGSVLYSFSGFSASAILFNHFHDIMALFPFLLIALEDKLENKRRGLFALAVFINCLCNYYFFIGEAIFLVIYYLVRFARKDKAMLKEIASLLMEGIFGVMAAGVLFVPSVLAIMDNPRSSSGIRLTSMSTWKYKVERYLAIYKAFILPSDIMSAQSNIIEHDYTSCAAYLPGVGISFALSYVLSRKGWLRKLLLILTAATLIPIIGSVFILFREFNFRWLYMFILMLSLTSAKVIDEELIRTGITRTAVLAVAALVPVYIATLRFIASRGKLSEEAGDTGIIRPGPFYLRIVLAIAPLAIILALTFVKNSKAAVSGLLSVIVLMSVATLAINISEYRKDYDTKLRKDWFEAAVELDKYSFDNNYRSNNTRNYFCMAGGAHGIANFCSTITGSIYKTYNTFGLERGPQVIDLFKIPGFKEYLSGRYLIDEEVLEGDEILYTFEASGRTWYVTDDGPVCPVAFTYGRSIRYEDLLKLPEDVRAMAAMNYLAIGDQDILTPITDREFFDTGLMSRKSADIRNRYLEDSVSSAIERQAQISDITSRGFVVTTTEDHETFLFVSCPYSRGWSAAGDMEGSKKIYEVNGFMAVSAKPGEAITFTYETPGLKAGIALTIFGLLAIAGLIITSPQLSKTSLQFVNRGKKSTIVQ